MIISRSLRNAREPFAPFICARCRLLQRSRGFATSAAVNSGHNRWSKIKHDKAKEDAIKNKQRSVFSHEIALASKFFGPDPNLNPRLALAIQNAKKAGFPKASIEGAIARGQGVSASGAKLESIIVEAMIPPSVAAIVDCQTDNKLKTLAEIKLVIKTHGGQTTPTGYLFDRKGRVVFVKKEGVTADDLMEPALNAGALDIEEDEEGRHVVYTEPAATKAVADALMQSLGLEVQASDIVYDPQDKVEISTAEDGENLGSFIDKLKDISGVQEVYINAA